MRFVLLTLSFVLFVSCGKKDSQEENPQAIKDTLVSHCQRFETQTFKQNLRDGLLLSRECPSLSWREVEKELKEQKTSKDLKQKIKDYDEIQKRKAFELLSQVQKELAQ